MLKLSQIIFTAILFIFNLFHTAKQRLTPTLATISPNKKNSEQLHTQPLASTQLIFS